MKVLPLQASSTVQTAVKTASFLEKGKTLASRVSCNWREYVMVAGVAIAITGLIVSLIASAFFEAAAFRASGRHISIWQIQLKQLF